MHWRSASNTSRFRMYLKWKKWPIELDPNIDLSVNAIVAFKWKIILKHGTLKSLAKKSIARITLLTRYFASNPKCTAQTDILPHTHLDFPHHPRIVCPRLYRCRLRPQWGRVGCCDCKVKDTCNTANCNHKASSEGYSKTSCTFHTAIQVPLHTCTYTQPNKSVMIPLDLLRCMHIKPIRQIQKVSFTQYVL